MSKHDLTIFRYSTMLTLTRNGISTFAELEAVAEMMESKWRERNGKPKE